VDPAELLKSPYNYMGWMVLETVNLLGPKDTMEGSGPSGRFEENDYRGTPLGELAAANASTGGLASYDDFEMPAAYTGTQAGGGNVLYRLREGIERFLVTDINNPAASAGAQSDIPVMWDHLTPQIQGSCHIPGGMNVLYLDGHVAWASYKSASPWMATIQGPRVIGRYDRPFNGYGGA
jgi:prepilin-type processing-associated H-X9-DG protein